MLSEFSVRRWQFTLVVFFGLSALGVSALFSVPKAEDPSVRYAGFAISVVLPGASPGDMERMVVDPMEARLKGLNDLKSVKSEIEDSLAVLLVEYEADSDPDRKHDEIQREMNALRPVLPPEVVRLDVLQFGPSAVNILEVALVSEAAPFAEIDHWARTLKRRLENARGVSRVETAGLPEREVRVELDLAKLVELRIAPEEILSAIGRTSVHVPAGSVDAGPRRFNVKSSGGYGSVEEVQNTLVRSERGSVLRVADLATVELVDAEATQITRFERQRAVLIAVAQATHQNVFDVRAALQAELNDFERLLPASIKLKRGFDQSKNVDHRLGGVGRDLALAIVLVLLTLLPLGLRASLVVMISIPLSLAMGLVLLDLTGYTLNQLSIIGFVIALGLLVDDSVVVVENIARHMRQGTPARPAAIVATREITASVLGCTATLVFAFVPLLALPGTAGQFIRSLPVALVYTILASLLVSLTIVPFLSSVLLKPESTHGNPIFRAMNWMIQTSYRPLLARAMAHPAMTLAGAACLLGVSLLLIPHIGFSLFPKAGTPQFLIQIETPEGSNLEETDRAARFAEEVLARHPEVTKVATSVGKGHPRIYYNILPKMEKANIADVFAEAAVDSPQAMETLLNEVRTELSHFAGAKLELVEFQNGPLVDAPVAIRLLGADEKALDSAARDVERVLTTLAGTRDVRNPSRDQRSDLRVAVDRDKAAILGVSIPNIDRTLRLAIGGVVAGTYRDPAAEHPYDIRVTLARNLKPGVTGALRPDVDLLSSLYVGNTHGGALPLAQVSHLVFEPSATKIRHHNNERSVTVTANVRAGFNTDRVTKEALKALSTLTWPPGVRWVAAGELESRQESFAGLNVALLVAAFGVLAILVLEFGTFKGTLIVASAIPLGVIGGLSALFVSGYTLSFTAVIGFVALMGIEVKNSILLVDFTNQLREEGVGLDEAIRHAGEVRFVPILLTTLTAIGGLLPLALERSALYSPLAIVILGGLVSSTLLSRIVTPVLYRLLAPEVMARSTPMLAPPSAAPRV